MHLDTLFSRLRKSGCSPRLMLLTLLAVLLTVLLTCAIELALNGEITAHDIRVALASALCISAILGLPLIRLARQQAASSAGLVAASRNNENLAHENARHYRQLIDAAPFPIAITDIAENTLRYLNHKGEQLFGIELKEVIGQSTSRFFNVQELHQHFRRAAPQPLCEDTTTLEFEIPMRTAGGREFWALLSIARIAFEGRPAYMTAINDITVHKLSAEIMQQGAERYRNLIEAAPFPVIVSSLETGMIAYGNQRAAELFGIPREEGIGKTAMDFYVHPDERAAIMAKLAQGIPVFDHAVELRKLDGTTFWALLSVTRIEFDGKPALLASINDISDRKAAEEALRDSERKLNDILDNISAYVYLKDTEGRYLYANRMVCELWDTMPEDVIGQTDEKFFDAETFEKIRANDRRVLVGGETLKAEETNATQKSGQVATYWSVKLPLRDKHGNINALVGISTDITERKQAEDKLRLSARVFNEAHEGILITDARGIVVDLNPAFCEITGYTRDEILGQNPSMLKSGRQSPEFYAAMWKSLAETGVWQGELWNRRKDGALYAELLSISALRDELGNIRHYIGMFSDITQSKQQQHKLEMLAHYDALTHLPNRMLLADRFNQAIARCKRDSDSLLAVCYLDLDGFKQVNDALGHDAGDRLLVQVAERIKSVLREEDTVSRLGGDEFALLLGDIHSLDQCEQALERIHRTIAQPYLLGEQSVTIGASSGVSIYPLDDADPDTLLRHADQAMYEAKMAGRNRFQLFDAAHDQLLQQQRIKLESIEQALQNGELHLYYQPKVNMKTGGVFGAEALIRWLHPERGIIPPIEFLPVVEGTPFEITLGNWVIERALSQLDTWQKSGLDLQVSVNISPNHLQDKRFFSDLDAALAQYPDVAPDRFEIEVLESGVVEDIAATGDVLSACRNALGVNVALDDFGTGYSSLTHLRHLPANMIKVDQSFVRDMIDDPDDFSIVEGVVGLADAFRRQVIAEGVETAEHGLMLLALGGTLAQGYAVARPMPAEALAEWVKTYQPSQPWLAFAGEPQSHASTSVMLLKIESRQWVKRVEDCLQALPEGTLHWPIMNYDNCHCGRWVLRAKKEGIFPLGQLDRLDAAHQKMHHLGSTLMRQHLDGHVEAARARIPELSAACKTIHTLLDDMLRAYLQREQAPSES